MAMINNDLLCPACKKVLLRDHLATIGKVNQGTKCEYCGCFLWYTVILQKRYISSIARLEENVPIEPSETAG